MNATLIERIVAVFQFEWRRALTWPRMTWMATLALFPPALLLLMRWTAGSFEIPWQGAAIAIFALAPSIACIMAVFLWATPSIASELEGRSWVYLAVRPDGPVAVLLGKYLAAVTWALPVGLIASTLSTLVLVKEEVLRMLVVQNSLSVLSCIAYAAVFLLIGVIVPKRAMVVGIIYGILFEAAASTIPAAINLITIQHRLRCLLVRGLGFDQSMAQDNVVFQAYFGQGGLLWHTAILLAMTVAFLVIAVVILRWREFTTASESET
ncbi:MAG: hypothetical protein ACKN81_15035 [Pirellulaceae bacterium]